MKHLIKAMALAITFALIAPAVTNAQKKKEKKAWQWEMPSKMTGIKDFDEYLLLCDTLNTRIKSYKDSVTFYSVRIINVQQKDGSVVQRRCVVDQNDNIRGSSEALMQYMDMILAGTGIITDMASITAETAIATASLTENPLAALTHGKYLKAGPKLVVEGTKTIKELLSKMKAQRQEIRQYKKDFTETGELADPTIDPATIDSNYANSEPITKTSEEFEKELAAAMAKDASITLPEEGDDPLDGVL